jgi:hypothetical protein
MNFVAEHHFANSFGLYLHITGVAGNTVAGHAKGRVAIVAGSARFAVFHRFHRFLVAVVLGPEGSRVALTTTKHVAVNIMAEHHVADIRGPDRNIAGMALGAVAFDAERSATIVTGAAGLSLLHDLHTDMVAVSLLFEELRMAKIAVGAMPTMAENNLADCPGLNGYFVDHISHSAHVYSVEI